MATATFWRTFHHEGKIGEGGGGARPPSFTLFAITYKVAVYVYAPGERADTLTLPYFISTPICTLWYYNNKPEL